MIGHILGNDKRTRLLNLNILSSIFIKGWNGIVQLLFVPITLGCLNQYEYGIWLTINSILIWIDTFDVGLGNGLRNNLTIAIANNDFSRGKVLVSTTFGMLLLIVLPLFMCVTTIMHFADMYALLNASRETIGNLDSILIASFACVCMTFTLKFIGNIYMAMQLPAVSNAIVAIGQTVALVLLVIMSKMNDVSLFDVSVAYAVSPLLVYVLFYPITFVRYKALTPNLLLFSKKELRGLFSLGVKFFILQLGALVLFTTSNLIISHMFSPAKVTPYQISQRYFGLINILFTVISAPLWSATTDAYARNDWHWIKNTERRMIRIVLLMWGVLLVMLLISPFFYSMWVGEEVEIPLLLSGLTAFYIMLVVYSTCYSNIICGLGKIKLLTIATVLEALLYVPLAFYFGNMLGVSGIVLALVVVTAFSAVMNRLQFKKIPTAAENSIWNK